MTQPRLISVTWLNDLTRGAVAHGCCRPRSDFATRREASAKGDHLVRIGRFLGEMAGRAGSAKRFRIGEIAAEPFGQSLVAFQAVVDVVNPFSPSLGIRTVGIEQCLDASDPSALHADSSSQHFSILK